MPFYITQVRLKTDDGVAANYVTNTYSMFAADLVGLALAHSAIWARYNNIRTYMSAQLAQNNHEITSYLRADPTPRAPVLVTQHNYTSDPAGTPMPPEVSICLSFQSDRESGVSQARRRGRVYLGPFNSTILGTDGRTNGTFRTAVVDFGQALLDASDAATDWAWFIWSTVDQDHSPVTNGWVDNEFDTQRRRGREYTLRTTFS